MDITTCTVDSPWGPWRVWATPEGLCGLSRSPGERTQAFLRRRFGSFVARDGDPHGAAAALAAWFDGRPGAAEALPLDLGGTDFQAAVWNTLLTIPRGATWTYGDLAGALGKPGAVRAVGAANGANPVALLVPCHRVVGADGSLHGYAGGLDLKRALLALEGVVVPAERQGSLFGSG